MKVRIIQTVKVDPEAWALTYNVELSEVRADVKDYFACWSQEQIDHVGCGSDESTGDQE